MTETRMATELMLASDQRDTLLALVLGSLSAERRFEELVSRTVAMGQPLDADDPVVLTALGLISLGRTLQRWLDASVASPSSLTSNESATHSVLGDLLR